MFKLIKNVEIYNPQPMGNKDVLICNDKIIKIGENLEFQDAEVINKKGCIAIPGIIDQHIHITGGGGEGGFHTRTPEVQLSDLIKSGVTTVVGLLGTDSYTQGIEHLLAKAKALNTEGVTAFCLAGAYHYPSPTLTGDVAKDITFINEIIGVKLAISDHREPFINKDELKKLASKVRVSSMISGKPGIMTLHMGNDDKNNFRMLFEIIDETSFPIKHFRPTHVNRNPSLFEDSLKFLEKGGIIDITVGATDKIINDIKVIEKKDLPLNQVTFSSDGNGSWSKYDEDGKLLEIGVSGCDGILKSIKSLIDDGRKIEEAITFGTSNVAKALSLANKGYLEVGKDADVLILDKDFSLDTVIAMGEIYMKDKKMIKKGTYEK